MNIYYEDKEVITPKLLTVMEQALQLAITFENEDMMELIAQEGGNPEDYVLLEEKRAGISVSFVDLNGIHQLNLEHRGIDRPTDVLSFPQYEDLFEEMPDEGEFSLGDVVVCKEKCAAQAEEFGHSFEREIVYLFVHSVLHLLGYDHEEDEDKTIMRAREEEIMEAVNLC